MAPLLEDRRLYRPRVADLEGLLHRYVCTLLSLIALVSYCVFYRYSAVWLPSRKGGINSVSKVLIPEDLAHISAMSSLMNSDAVE